LPLKKTTDYTEPLKPDTLKETYDFILADITAPRIPRSDVDGKGLADKQKRIDGLPQPFLSDAGRLRQMPAICNSAPDTQTGDAVGFPYRSKPASRVLYQPGTTLKYSELMELDRRQHLYWKEFLYTRDSYTNTHG